MKDLQLQNSILVAQVEDYDWERLSKFKWYYCKDGAVYRTYVGTQVSFHNRFKTVAVSLANEVMRTTRVMYDHKDRNPLNHAHDNLRKCTSSQNMANRPKFTVGSSKYKGVSLQKKAKTWRASIKVNGDYIVLGSFKVEAEAAIAYNRAAIKYFGEFAYLNEI